MDSIRRLIRMMLYFLVGVLLSAVSILSYADTYPAVKGWGSPVGSKSQDQMADTSCKGSGFVSGVGISGTNDCKCTKADGTFYTYATACTGSYYCPAGGTLSGTSCINAPVCPGGQSRDSITGSCSCPAGRTYTGGMCQETCVGDQHNDSTGACVCDPTSGRTVSYSVPYASSAKANPCMNGCLQATTSYNIAFCAFNPLSKGPTTCYTRTAATGETCSTTSTQSSTVSATITVSSAPSDTTGTNAAGTAPDPKNTPTNNADPYSCGSAGGSYGVVNGVSKCLTPSSSSPVVQTQVPSSSTTTTPTSTSTTTNVTSCTGDGACSTTSTTTTTSGGSGLNGTGTGSTTSTSTKTGDTTKSAFCSENSTASICNSGSFSGTCDAAPTCEGDAVQCATAKAVFELKCSAVKDDDQQKLARGVVAGNDPKAGQLPDPANPTEVAIGTLSTDEIFAASCPSNPTMTAFGHTYTFSLAPLCQLGGVLGQLNVMLALIAALWLIGGSVKGA